VKNVCQQIRFILPIAVIALILNLPCSSASAHNGTSNGQQTTVAQTTTPTPEDQSTQKVTTTKPKAKPAVAKTRDKSVLDAEVLDSPLSYFKEAFTPEDENTPALVNTVKALVATLLSTVM